MFVLGTLLCVVFPRGPSWQSGRPVNAAEGRGDTWRVSFQQWNALASLHFYSQAIGQHGHPTTGDKGLHSSLFPGKESGTLGEALMTTMATCQWFQQCWQVFRVEFLVFGFVHVSSSMPVDWNVCVQLWVDFWVTLQREQVLDSLLFPAWSCLIPIQSCEMETTVLLF